MSGFVYILKSETGSLYVGSTSDLDRRVMQHRFGHTQTTRNRAIKRLVFSQKFRSLTDARKVEARLKELKRKDYLEKIINDGYIKLADKLLS